MIDYSTLNEKEIKKLGVYVKPPTYHVSDHLGSGCYLDVPGYPTYFIRSIYTANGNNPRQGSTQEVIEYKGTLYKLPDFWVGSKSWEECQAKREKLFNRLYVPLPEDHPRVQAWIHAKYAHFKNCYYDASAEGSDKILIYPVPYYKLKTPHIDWIRWSVEYIMQHCAEIAAYNRMVIDHAMEVATIENHKAVRAVREVYPNHVPYVGLRHNPKPSGNWYERLAERPTPDNCPGDSIGKHPVNNSWCQCCGWKAENS